MQSTGRDGGIPFVEFVEEQGAEYERAIAIAVAMRASLGSERQVAVICVDSQQLATLIEAASGVQNIAVVRSRDDVVRLQYRRRSIVVSSAEYLAGLQFSDVVVCGVGTESGADDAPVYTLRLFISQLYLAVSRSSLSLGLVMANPAGVIASVIQSAIQEGLLIKQVP